MGEGSSASGPVGDERSALPCAPHLGSGCPSGLRCEKVGCLRRLPNAASSGCCCFYKRITRLAVHISSSVAGNGSLPPCGRAVGEYWDDHLYGAPVGPGARWLQRRRRRQRRHPRRSSLRGRCRAPHTPASAATRRPPPPALQVGVRRGRSPVKLMDSATARARRQEALALGL